MTNILDARTEETLRRQVWYWALTVVGIVLALTAGLMWLRQGLSLHWSFSADEFEAVGTWFSGMAAAAALFSGAALVVNDRRAQRVRDRLAEANEIRYSYREDHTPIWIVRNGSSRSVIILEADGHSRYQLVFPGGELRLRDATMLARAGYRGDQPSGDLAFEDGEYRWRRAGSTLRGIRIVDAEIDHDSKT